MLKPFYFITLVGMMLCVVPLPVGAQTIGSDDGVESLNLERYSGIAQPEREVVLAAASDGLLLDLSVEEGQQVRGGHTLGRLDDRVQTAVVESASLRFADTSRIEQAAAQVSILEFDLRKVTELHEKGVANLREVDIAKVKLKDAEAAMQGMLAEHQQLESDLQVERERLEALHFAAPFDGVILERMAEPGAALRVGDGVYRLASLDPLRVELPLPVELYPKLSAGASYNLVAEGPVNEPIRATLRTIRPEIDSASATFVATFEIRNPDLALPAGFRVYLESPDQVEIEFMLSKQ